MKRKCFMKRFSSMLVAVALGGCYATVGEDGRRGGGEAGFTLNLPAVLPPLIVVQPGVSVARDMDDEVFYADGYYWARQDRRWFRAHDHRSGWARIEDRQVPAVIVQSPPGRYRHYRGDEHQQGNQEHRGDQEHSRRDGHEGHEGHEGDRR
jgi:hypothetical protein